MSQSCRDQAKQATAQYYSRPNVSINEIRNPETVIIEQFGFEGDIVSPKVYSPQQFMYKHAFLQKEGTVKVLKDLVTAEKIARRQYDELIMLPDLKPFVPDLLHIRNEEHEHEKILECIIQRLGAPAAAQPTISQQSIKKCPVCNEIFNEFKTKADMDLHIQLCHTPQPRELPKIKYIGRTWYFDKRLSQIRDVNNPSSFLNLTEDEVATLDKQTSGAMTLTPKGIGELYVTMLDRFAEMEQKDVNSYLEFLIKAQESEKALDDALTAGSLTEEQYNKVWLPVHSLERKINKHLNEERTHLDVINAMREMFSNMKSGQVY